MKLTNICKTLMAVAVIIAASQASAEDNRAVVHDARGNVVRSTFGPCVRTKWVSNSDECGNAAPVAAKKVLVEQESRTIYFDFNKSSLNAVAVAKLDSMADVLKSEKSIRGVRIVGYADRIGSASYNEALSKKRAEEVEKHLRESGYLNTTVAKTRWLGDSAPITQCSEKLKRPALIACLQKDRRVEVELDYLTDKKTAQ